MEKESDPDVQQHLGQLFQQHAWNADMLEDMEDSDKEHFCSIKN